MKVENKIHIYRIDGVDTKVGEKTELIMTNVWNRKQFVELQIGDGKKVVVRASDLNKAIDNSTGNDD
jgi:hypothetical protein